MKTEQRLDLISRSELIKAGKNIHVAVTNYTLASQIVVEQGRLFRKAVEEAPAVDAVEVVHGEWSTIEDDYCGLVALHCSVCNQEWWFEEDAPIKHYHYCPCCGAKMDGGNEDENRTAT